MLVCMGVRRAYVGYMGVHEVHMGGTLGVHQRSTVSANAFTVALRPNPTSEFESAHRVHSLAPCKPSCTLIYPNIHVPQP